MNESAHAPPGIDLNSSNIAKDFRFVPPNQAKIQAAVLPATYSPIESRSTTVVPIREFTFSIPGKKPINIAPNSQRQIIAAKGPSIKIASTKSRSYQSQKIDQVVKTIQEKVRGFSLRDESESEDEIQQNVPVVAAKYATLVEKFTSQSNSEIHLDYNEDNVTPYMRHLNYTSNLKTGGRGYTLADSDNKFIFQECAYIGKTSDRGESVYLNVHEPFCMISCGVQGAGEKVNRKISHNVSDT